ncbi:hypothetical protein ACVWYH_000652 [Bradyrhizobium sp. GM24.11]
MSDPRFLIPEASPCRSISYAGDLVAIGAIYFALAKGGLALASIHPSATPIWPPTGVALAAVLLRGYRIWPAIFTAAMVANATTAGSVATSMGIATGNSLEAVVGAYLINRWSGGCNTLFNARFCRKVCSDLRRDRDTDQRKHWTNQPGNRRVHRSQEFC